MLIRDGEVYSYFMLRRDAVDARSSRLTFGVAKRMVTSWLRIRRESDLPVQIGLTFLGCSLRFFGVAKMGNSSLDQAVAGSSPASLGRGISSRVEHLNSKSPIACSRLNFRHGEEDRFFIGMKSPVLARSCRLI